MKIKKIVFLLGVFVAGRSVATDVFLLNKTGIPFYYAVAYQTAAQDILNVAEAGVHDQKMQQWFNEQLDPKRGEGVLAPNNSAQVKSYRVKWVCISETRPDSLVHHAAWNVGPRVPPPAGQIVSFTNDQRICSSTHKQSDCFGSTMHALRPSLVDGSLVLQQKGLTNLARPLVFVVTRDPELEKQGKIGFIVTETPHTWDILQRRTPTKFFYEVQGLPTPTVKK
jgi:hypothetical protein